MIRWRRNLGLAMLVLCGCAGRQAGGSRGALADTARCTPVPEVLISRVALANDRACHATAGGQDGLAAMCVARRRVARVLVDAACQHDTVRFNCAYDKLARIERALEKDAANRDDRGAISRFGFDPGDAQKLAEEAEECPAAKPQMVST